MNTKTLFTTLAACAVFAGTTTPAFAVPEIDDGRAFATLMTMKQLDTDKDGMVSKQEFLDAMAKVWDSKSKQMKATGNRFTEAQMREVLMYLRAGA